MLTQIEAVKKLILSALENNTFVDPEVENLFRSIRVKNVNDGADLVLSREGRPPQTIGYSLDRNKARGVLDALGSFDRASLSLIMDRGTEYTKQLTPTDRKAVDWAVDRLTQGLSINLTHYHTHPTLSQYSTGGLLSPDDQISGSRLRDMPPTQLTEVLARGAGWKSRPEFLRRLTLEYHRYSK